MSPTSAAAKAPAANANEPLFEPYQLGPLHLSNRIVMAPMTRSRAIDGNIPNPLAETYYRQRAGAGLIITEGSQVSPQGQGYIRTPGIHSPDQIAAWRKITAAVAREGGKIFLQLWHVGRISHPDFHDGALPVAPSAIIAEGDVFTAQGPKKMVAPRALDASELSGIVDQFRKGAENAKAAGFDGVEIHGANGYLLDQFTRDGSNQRTDSYGGSLENRVRFPLEVTKAVIEVWGKDRVGYRISPNGAYNSMSDSDPAKTFAYLTERLSELGIVYLHTFDPPSGANHLAPHLRTLFKGSFIVNGGYDEASGNAAIANGEADLVAYGVPFLANPDLPYRFGKKAKLNAPDQATFYAGEDRGYTDYPALVE
jgi:N-ethylmaleimide reductase